MTNHPTITSEAPSSASLPFDASLDSIDSLNTSFTESVVPTLETTTVTEVALGYHRNQQYSITAMTTSTGAVAERYAYTAYGQPTILSASGTVLTSSAVGNRYTYTGREWDETLGLHHFRARWMSPLAGRFLGRDPIGYFARETYAIVVFLTNLDPTGWTSITDSDIRGMWGCLNANYVQQGLFPDTDPTRICKFLPLTLATRDRLIGLVGEIGVGVILASVKGILPEGLTGVIAEALLENILSRMTCNPTDTIEQVKATILQELKRKAREAAGQSIDPQALSALEIIATQLADHHSRSCKPNTSCLMFSHSGDSGDGQTSNCTFNLCKTINGNISSFTLSGTCRYKCEKSSRQKCCCGDSFTSHFTGISWTRDDDAWFSSNCTSFSNGSTNKLQ